MAKTKDISKLAKAASALGLGLVALNSSGSPVLIDSGKVTEFAGGRNLIAGSNIKTSHLAHTTFAQEEEKFEGMTVYRKDKRWGDTGIPAAIVAGEAYTFSVFVKATPENTPGLTVKFSSKAEKVDNCAEPVMKSVKTIVNNETFVRVAITFVAPMDCFAVGLTQTGTEVTDPIWWCGEKLERGSVASDWSPAPEDYSSLVGGV